MAQKIDNLVERIFTAPHNFKGLSHVQKSWWLFPVPVLRYLFHSTIITIQNLKYQMTKLKIMFKAKPQLTSQIEFLIYNSHSFYYTINLYCIFDSLNLERARFTCYINMTDLVSLKPMVEGKY